MNNNKDFYKKILHIAIPITLQSLLQAALSLIDSIMVGQLGSDSIAGIGLSSKFVSLFSVTVMAIVTVAGILIAQYLGSKNQEGVNNSFHFSLYIALLVTFIFTLLSAAIPEKIMSLYSQDGLTIAAATTYLRITSIGFFPMMLTMLCSVYLRNQGRVKIPMYASLAAVVTNIILNYVLIFGKCGFPRLGLAGAAWATTIARVLELTIVLVNFLLVRSEADKKLWFVFRFEKEFVGKVFRILSPILMCEFLWSLGENVYAVIYGHLGTEACAAMTLTYPVQSLMIGALSGVASASAILIGQRLGANKMTEAYLESVILIRLTVLASVVIGVIILCFSRFYVLLFNVPAATRQLTVSILYAYALVFAGKVINMVLCGGILRSGGKTRYIMIIDIIGTWVIGVPLGLLAAFTFHLPIYLVYFILSLEEYVRVVLGAKLFIGKKWMNNVTEH